MVGGNLSIFCRAMTSFEILYIFRSDKPKIGVVKVFKVFMGTDMFRPTATNIVTLQPGVLKLSQIGTAGIRDWFMY